MNTLNVFPGHNLKYTRYLINGNFAPIEDKPNSIFISGVLSLLDIFRAFSLLGFCVAMIPFAVAIDIGRLLYSYQIRFSRKFKRTGSYYNLTKSATYFVYRGIRISYLLNRKTDSPHSF